ncbi:protein phosphatase 1 regulatory subunit 1A isoform X2 [Globicephala melas]|uniref:protein phosphatase 1 regulatory subunit 1A isoform X2 n=1 Tax=Globicephala melas TaxID=9731 RepID=UPI00293D553E|nr:protein phosphatase 1 regulatory subunit 1A isoform X2 [Globicephala melas]
MRRQKGVWGKQGVEVVFWVPRAEGWAQERPPGECGFSVTWHFWRCAKWAAWIMLPSVRGAAMLPRVLDLFPQIRRRRPTPATLVLTSDQSSPEVDEDRVPNPHLKKKVMRTTPTMKELQMMVEHHLGQQQEGEEPEGAAESTGTRESCPPGIGDTAAESWLGTSGKAHKPAESIPNTQERGSEKPSTEEPSTHRPPLDSKGASSV